MDPYGQRVPAQVGTRQVVEGFLRDVRSGQRPGLAFKYMADEVHAHQLESERRSTVTRTPAEYAEHLKDVAGPWSGDVRVEELLVDGAKAYVRWSQTSLPREGRRAVTRLASAVYRVEAGKIAEYWIQIDREGLRAQEAAPR